MKFISGIKKTIYKHNLSIKIPSYHRMGISFYDGSEVYYITRSFKSNESLVRELILTPLDPDTWNCMRKVTINSIDTPGIIHTITDKLRELKINVNIEEALATQLGSIHTITLIIDLFHYLEHSQNNNTKEKVSKETIKHIEDKLNELKYPGTDIRISKDNNISIKELTFLESMSNISGNEEYSHISERQFRHHERQHIKIQKGKIELTETIINALQLSKEQNIHYTMFSDTEERYLKIVFFDPKQTVAFIDVYHEDIYGAISKFTEIIFNKYQLNIIACYSHAQMLKNTAHWFALVDITNKEYPFYSEILNNLTIAEYGDDQNQKKVKEVFLIETTNTESIDPDTIMKYGQNKKTREGEITTVYKKKKEMMKQILFSEDNLKSFQKNKEFIIKKYGLQNTKSVIKLCEEIIQEKDLEQKKEIEDIATTKKINISNLNSVVSWGLSIFIVFIIVTFLLKTFSQYKQNLLSGITDAAIEAGLFLSLALVVFLKFRIEPFIRDKLNKKE
jgi:predicted amino acid-binding ACT domain protein